VVRDYDINDAGAGGGGIGFQTLVETFRPNGYVRDSAVVAPSQMLAFGDSVLKEGFGFTDMIGRSILWGSSRFDPAAYYGSRFPFNTPELTKAQIQRHHGKFNVAFCDAHVESLKTNQLFGLKDDVIRLWNRDHEPHPEAWSKFFR